jgi:hypothetical protein
MLSDGMCQMPYLIHECFVQPQWVEGRIARALRRMKEIDNLAERYSSATVGRAVKDLDGSAQLELPTSSQASSHRAWWINLIWLDCAVTGEDLGVRVENLRPGRVVRVHFGYEPAQPVHHA